MYLLFVLAFLLLVLATPTCSEICTGIITFPCRITTCFNSPKSGISYCNASNNFKQLLSPAVFCVQLVESYRGHSYPMCSERKYCPIKGCIQLCVWFFLLLFFFVLSLRKHSIVSSVSEKSLF